MSMSTMEESTPSLASELGEGVWRTDEGAWQTEEGAWRARCLELEVSLQKFRDQAQRIREILRDKVRIKSLKYKISIVEKK